MVIEKQTEFDYVFEFKEKNLGYFDVSVFSAKTNVYTQSQVGIEPFSIDERTLNPLQQDLLNLASAIHIIDKVVRPKTQVGNYIKIALPMLNQEVFLENSEQIEKIIAWYTGDIWDFSFSQSKREVTKQASLFQLNQSSNKTETALWRGGLDSLAGLWARLQQSPKLNFLLVGTGNHPTMLGRQKQVFDSIKNSSIAKGRIGYLQIKIKTKYGDKSGRNQLNRARALVFLLIGAVSSMLKGSKALNVYENGIGAINLSFPGGIGARDHSRAVHPYSLFLVEDFLRKVTKLNFSIQNPFLFHTKADMCKNFSHMHKKFIFETISCDRLHRKKYIQCGYCSSCLLRQQAIIGAGFYDETRYYVPHATAVEAKYLDFFNKMDQQVNVFKKALDNDNSWSSLKGEFSTELSLIPEILKSNSQCSENLCQLYSNYVYGWEETKYKFPIHSVSLNRPYHHKEDEQCQQMPLIV